MPQDKPVVIVTGSSGLLGAAVVHTLAPRFQVVGFDLKGQPHPPPQVESVCVDLTDESSVESGLERVRYAYGRQIAAVVHLAAYYDFSGHDSPLYQKVTVEGTRRLLDALEGFDVERFIFSSTMLAHAPTEPGQPIDESHPLKASWPYPNSKIETEQMIADHRGAIPAVSLRIAGVYTDRCDSIPLSHQIQRIYERRITGRVYPGHTDRGQTFVHLDDVVSAIAACIDKRRDLPANDAILIGESETYSYDTLQRRLAQLIHGDDDWDTEHIPKTVAKTGAWVQGKIPGLEEPFIKPWMIDHADDHYELNIERARRELGWRPAHRLIDALPSMVEALIADPARWYAHHKLDKPANWPTRPAGAEASP